MSKLLEEEYKFFIEEENFKTMGSVANKAETVAKKLIEEFWLYLKDFLKRGVQQELGQNWIVEFSGEFDQRYCKLQIYNKSWMGEATERIVAVAFENLHFGQRPFIGILINKGTTPYNPQEIRNQLLLDERLQENLTQKNDWWASIRFLDISFSNYESFVEILPSQRNTLVENLKNEVVQIAKIIDENIVDVLSRSRR